MPKFPRDIGEACLPFDPVDRGEVPLGHQRAPTRMQRTTVTVQPPRCGATGATASFRTPGVGELPGSVCGPLGAGAGFGSWFAYCDLQRGQLLLSDRPFPGASARLLLQVRRAPAVGSDGRNCRYCLGLGPGESCLQGLGARPITSPRPPPPTRAISSSF